MTTSFSVTPLPLAMCLIPAKGNDRLEKLRWLVMLTLMGVLGANQRFFCGLSTSSKPATPKAGLFAFGRAQHAVGGARQAGQVFSQFGALHGGVFDAGDGQFGDAKVVSRHRAAVGAGRTARGTAVTSMMAVAKATPAAPSSAAW